MFKVFETGDGNMKTHNGTMFQKCVMLHSFKQNGLQIRNQRKKLHMVALGENNFRRNFEILQQMFDFESYIVKN